MNKQEYDANQLFEAGGILLFFDTPLNSEFGIDYNCWRTGENFRGVKMIPPGVHYIYFSVADKHGSIGIRNGFFYNFKLKEVVAKKWNKETELIEDYALTEDQTQTFIERKREYDKFLGAYPFDEYKRWVSLTNCLNEDLVNHLIPENKIISSGSCLIGKKFSTHRTKTEPKEKEEIFKIPQNIQEAEKRLPEMEHEEFTNIRFSKIPEESFPKGSNPIEITSYSIDMSYKLELLIQEQNRNLKKHDPNNMLGEVQFSFICFLIGHVYDALEQWKRLVNLLCNSERSIKQYPELFIQFIQVLYFELKEMPDDFFTDIVTSNNFLVVNLHNFFDNVKSAVNESIDKNQTILKLNEKSEKFKSYLTEKFNFNFEDEPDEYAPVVCEDVY